MGGSLHDDDRKRPGKADAKRRREARLAAALRANLKRRKAATAKSEPASSAAEGRKPERR